MEAKAKQTPFEVRLILEGFLRTSSISLCERLKPAGIRREESEGKNQKGEWQTKALNAMNMFAWCTNQDINRDTNRDTNLEKRRQTHTLQIPDRSETGLSV